MGKIVTWKAICKTSNCGSPVYHYEQVIPLELRRSCKSSVASESSGESKIYHIQCEGENPENKKHLHGYNFPKEFEKVE